MYIKQTQDQPVNRFWLTKKLSFSKLAKEREPLPSHFGVGDRVEINGNAGAISSITQNRQRVHVRFDGTRRPVECNPLALKKI